MVKVISNIEMEDEYTIRVTGNVVRVENISIPDSCKIDLTSFEDFEDGSIRKAYEKEDWNEFVCQLIVAGYLN